MRAILFILLMPAAWPASAQSKTYHFSSNSDLERLKTLPLKAGDTVYLHGIFSGSLSLKAGITGTSRRPIIITGLSRPGGNGAVINSGNRAAVELYQASYVVLNHLRLTGSGRKEGNTENGLVINTCRHITADSLIVEGFQKAGLMIYASTDVEVRRVYAHENGSAGIAIEGTSGKRSSRNIRIIDCRADDNPGDPTNLTNHSGNGIVAGHCTNLLIDHCSATNNGWDMPRIGNGPVGIWCYEADSVIIQHCLAYRNKTSAGAADGGGFDLDGGVTNSIIQYCLSYGNQGAGYCIFQYWGASPWHHNIIRYNISEDDGGVSDARAGIYVWNSSGDAGQFYDCAVYNNTVYNSREAALSYSDKSLRKGFVFYNNIFVGRDSLIRGDRGADVFRRNDWWVLRGEDRGRADAAEGGRALYRDPAFRDPGNTEDTTVAALKKYSKYRFPEGSPLRGLGANF